jgi:RHS repeat-associated protein
MFVNFKYTEEETSMIKLNKINFHSFPLYRKRLITRRKRFLPKESGKFKGKEQDPATRFYYYGARYLDPKTNRWMSGDPVLGEYIPGAPVDEEVKKRNGNLPGQGGVFNLVNLHVYHYTENNLVKYIDPDGRDHHSYLTLRYF